MKAFSVLDLRYLAARLSNMAVRPATISAVAYFFGKADAQQVSIIIFSVAIAMLAMSIDPHRAYYKRHFNDLASAHEFVIYIIIIIAWISVVSMGMVAFMAAQGIPALVCALSVAMFIGEKFADEILRFCLFRKDITTWSNLVLKRSGAQLLGLAVAILLNEYEYAFSLLLVAFTMGWTLSFYGSLKNILTVFSEDFSIFLRKKFYRRAGARVTSSVLLMASSLMSSSPSYFDKIVTLVADRASLPLFLIASMSFSLIGNFVDFFFVSKIRLELLQNSIGLGHIMFSKKLVYCVILGMIGGAALFAIQALILRRIYSFDLGILALVSAINIVLALTAIPQQIVYWRDGPRGIFIAELAFFLAVLVFYLCLGGTQWTLISALRGITVCLAFRFISYVTVSQHGPVVISLLTAVGRRNRD